MNGTKKYYELKKVSEEETELYIFGDIVSWSWFESDVGAFDIAKELSEVDTPLRVRINSYGGEVAEGLAIHSLLKSHKYKVTTICDGFACSAASVIFMAGEERIMRDSSLLMIHNAWTYARGNANDLRKAADDIEKITKPSLDIYESVAKISREEIQKMMDEETWITKEEALQYGFATRIEKEQAKQSINQSFMNKEVMKNKKLQERIKELENALESQKPKGTGWNAFFNAKK